MDRKVLEVLDNRQVSWRRSEGGRCDHVCAGFDEIKVGKTESAVVILRTYFNDMIMFLLDTACSYNFGERIQLVYKRRSMKGCEIQSKFRRKLSKKSCLNASLKQLNMSYVDIFHWFLRREHTELWISKSLTLQSESPLVLNLTRQAKENPKSPKPQVLVPVRDNNLRVL
ncbi:hypothetical protein RhiirC2_819250 [Rhizophagus irregularis]|uniref:Uncharacterized protein n=1 Tax=Rhizophagus irregularis TaxID=588596 RepID=A0A2N1MES1_9GLOM|nr:hypothetical protein RhiirC2_819250 [Rhizophagus irregularis]